jgi:pSer/pThr/pTyr-binding forkhead associated (FHA) protein
MIAFAQEVEPASEMAADAQEVEPALDGCCSLVPLRAGASAVMLAGFPVVIGRGFDADVRVEDAYVSRRHCEIVAANGALVVLDLGSKNGTFVNGVRTTISPLKPNDVLTLGGMQFVVQNRSAIAGSLNVG